MMNTMAHGMGGLPGPARLIAAVLSASMLAFSAAASDTVRDPYAHFFQDTFGDFTEEIEDARESGKKGVVIFFEMDECPFCERMRETVLNRADVQDYYREQFRIFTVDIEGDTEVVDFDGNEMPAKDFAFKVNKVRATPVIAFYDLDGRARGALHRRGEELAGVPVARRVRGGWLLPQDQLHPVQAREAGHGVRLGDAVGVREPVPSLRASPPVSYGVANARIGGMSASDRAASSGAPGRPGRHRSRSGAMLVLGLALSLTPVVAGAQSPAPSSPLSSSRSPLPEPLTLEFALVDCR